jgi:hypothetical protein
MLVTSAMGGRGRRIKIQGGPLAKSERPYLKIKSKKVYRR